MVGSPTARVNPSASDPLFENGIFDFEIEHLVNLGTLLGQHFIKLVETTQRRRA